MPRKSKAQLMFEFVQDYLNGEMDRIFFDMDFYYYLEQYFPAMKRQNPYMADGFLYYLGEQGLDCSENLSDAQYKKLIRRQWKQFNDALKDGMW